MNKYNAVAKKQKEKKIGELLIREGFITEDDLDKALLIQKKEASDAEVSFDILLIKKGFLNASQLEVLKGHPDLRKKIGEIVVEHEIIEADQVKKVLKDKKENHTLGQSLIEKGLITRDVLDELLEKQKDAFDIGELAVRLQMLREVDLVRALSYKNCQRTIGEILCDNRVIRPEDLSLALKKHNKRKKIGEILIRQGMIDKTQFQIAAKEQSQSKEKIGTFLINKGLITFHQLYNALSHQYNTPYMELDDFFFDELRKNDLIKFVSEKYARRNMVLPLTIEGKQLLIGITYPDGFTAIEELQLIYRNLDMKASFITEQKFEALFTSLYNKEFQIITETENEFSNVPDNINLFNFEKLTAGEKQRISLYAGTETETKKTVDYIINYGISNGASDIHFEQDRKGVKLRYRIDGVCQEPDLPWLKKKIETKPESIISRIKVMSNLDIAERRIPQDGVFRASYKENDKTFDLDFRVAVCPAIVGENITIRILDSRKAGLGLDNLNHSKHVLGPLRQLFKSSAGMILVSGPTGSGKSSTLYAALQYIHSPEIKIITAEDPIEYSFPGIMQTQINNKIGLTFSKLLRSFLRLDPDVILVGEIRDIETAGIGFDAAQTGHLLLSTIHTNDSVSAVSRLLDLGIDYNQIASSLIGVASQRLVRRNCTKCSRPFKPPQEEWSLFFNDYPEHITFYKGLGCKACDFSGYSGRTLISELFEIDRKITLAISCKTGEAELKRLAIRNGMKTMADDGLMKMNQISLTELIRVLPLEMIKEFKSRH
ncbi:MAG: Flp pilus assembly complex ATPase component TadA [Desulfobacula sp.]|uniref:GspE/PulE family protein n=1 Tax=Desulfobacula sp. TaxID=2593537 RepID=UPI0025C5651F|nr:type II/IV secretion system protein [Desulfobacula sp.]MCD4720825.1 Flp pilus assembly complex ATPase component TadA [Desulfobacula sp.]